MGRPRWAEFDNDLNITADTA
jgi:hypothetical protein